MGTIRARSIPTLDAKKRFAQLNSVWQSQKCLVENLPKIMDPKFTAHMEEDLDKIAQGELERDTFLREFYTTFQKDITQFHGQ